MSQKNITSVLSQIESFPALPASVVRVMEITSDPDSSAQDLMQAIIPDQSICVAILKLANSAFFGRPRKVSSIEEAVVVLGFQEIRNIVLTQAVFNSFQKFKNTNSQDIDTLWQHSLTCGLAARIIATHTPKQSPNHLFIAGLIHDIGKLAMLLPLPNSYRSNLKLNEQLRLSFFPEEEEKFGISHDTIGMRLLNRWLFPEQLCSSTGYHHHPNTAPGDATFPLIVQMANILSHVVHAKNMINGQEIMDMIHNFVPECTVLWEHYNFHWQPEDIDTWLVDIQAAINEESYHHIFAK